MKILFIEGGAASLKLTSDLVQAGGHVATLAASAGQTFYSSRSVKPDVTILDRQMPDIKGFAVARQRSVEPGTRDIPTIATKSFSEECGKNEAVKPRCNAYIVKPSDTRTRLRQIKGVVRAKSKSSLSKAHQ